MIYNIPIITDFEEPISLNDPVCKMNATEMHFGTNKKFPLQKNHFDAWLHLFNITKEELFFGERVLLQKKVLQKLQI